MAFAAIKWDKSEDWAKINILWRLKCIVERIKAKISKKLILEKI